MQKMRDWQVPVPFCFSKRPYGSPLRRKCAFIACNGCETNTEPRIACGKMLEARRLFGEDGGRSMDRNDWSRTRFGASSVGSILAIEKPLFPTNVAMHSLPAEYLRLVMGQSRPRNSMASGPLPQMEKESLLLVTS